MEEWLLLRGWAFVVKEAGPALAVKDTGVHKQGAGFHPQFHKTLAGLIEMGLNDPRTYEQLNDTEALPVILHSGAAVWTKRVLCGETPSNSWPSPAAWLGATQPLQDCFLQV